MFEKIIVGFDGTDTGADGLVLAVGLAKAFANELLVAYVYDAKLSAASREAAAELSRHAHEILKGARERVSQSLAVDFRAQPAGSPAQGLNDLAVSDRADLIVLGSRRLGPWTREALGGVSQEVMRGASRAVAVAPRGYRHTGGFVPQRIRVGWIPTAEGDRALEVACYMARATGGSVELVTSTAAADTLEQRAERARRTAGETVKKLGAKIPIAVNAQVAEPTDVLIESSNHVDLIVLGSRGYGSARTMLAGSTSASVVPGAQCPTLVLAAAPDTATTA